MSQIPVLPGKPIQPESERLMALFDELDKGKLQFLDEAGKRIIELCTGMLGLLFAVIAFGEKFPPAYLKTDQLVKTLAIVVLALYLLAMLAGLLTVQPRQYRRYEHNLSEMEKQLERIQSWKAGWMITASVFFFLASLTLAFVIGWIICKA